MEKVVATSDADELSQGTEEVRYKVNRMILPSGRNPPTVFELGHKVQITTRCKSYLWEGSILLLTTKKVIV